MAARPIPEDKVRQAEFSRAGWHVVPEPGTGFADLFEPGYWRVAARRMKPGDKIEVLAEGGAWYAELLVRRVDAAGLHVEELLYKRFAEAAARPSSSPALSQSLQPQQAPAPEPVAALTPDAALELLRAGNARYLASQGQIGMDPSRRILTSTSQSPLATIVGCSDSRVTPELLFGGLYYGELFIVRNAGHVPDTATIGSVEFAASVLKVPLVVVLGHEGCGAVQSACESVERGTRFPGSIGPIVDEIVPAARAVRGRPGDFVDNAVRENAVMTARNLIARSRILADLVTAGEIKVTAARYDLDQGRVVFLA